MTLVASEINEAPEPYRFTREEYYRLGELGFFEGKRTELIDGEIISMAPMKDLHAVAMGIVEEVLRRHFGDYWVRSQLPLSFMGDTEPVPDFSVVPGRPRDYKGKGHPSSALLVVEISDSTLRFDRKQKAALYARAGIPEYWILNLQESCLEVRRVPTEDPGSALGFRYETLSTLAPSDAISPLASPAISIPVADLLP